MFDRDAYLTWVKRELSVSLVRGNARLFKKFVGVLTRGIGVVVSDKLNRACACEGAVLMSL